MNERAIPESPVAWLQRARSDLALAHAGLDSPNVLREDVCFHAQQCVEKAFKALLISRMIPYPRTHSLEALIDLLKADGIEVPRVVDQSFSLSQYAVETRYPGDWEPVTEEETRSALETAELVLAWVQARIGE